MGERDTIRSMIADTGESVSSIWNVGGLIHSSMQVDRARSEVVIRCGMALTVEPRTGFQVLIHPVPLVVAW